MKQLIRSVLIILLLVGLATAHVTHLKNFTENLIGQLETAHQHLERREWASTKQAMENLIEQWEDHAFYLHTTLRHADIGAIRTSMREIAAYLDSREDHSECLAVAAKLKTQLELLLEAELPTIKNLL